MTYAIMGVDWETHQGVGHGIRDLQHRRRRASSPTSATATARTPTGGPRRSTSRRSTIPSCVRVTAAGRDSSFCSQAVRPACAQKDPETARRCTSRSRRTGRRRASTIRAGRRAIVWRPVEVTEPAGVHELHEAVRRRRVHLDAQPPARQPRARAIHGEGTAEKLN